MELATGLTERPYDTTSATSVLALCASSLAAGYIIFKQESYLTHAVSLYQAADKKEVMMAKVWLKLLSCN